MCCKVHAKNIVNAKKMPEYNLVYFSILSKPQILGPPDINPCTDALKIN